MNEHDPAAADAAFLEKVMRYQDGAMAAEELAAFEREMRGEAAKRRVFAEVQLRSMALHERFRQDAFRVMPPVKRGAWLASLIARPLTAAAAGLIIGLFCASFAWAVASPRAVATAERLFALVDGGFEDAAPAPGFPKQAGAWSGDASEALVAEGVKARERRRMLRFVQAEGDANAPDGRALACDVFQLVDLRPLRANLGAEGDSLLELSASFLDARPSDTGLSVTFFCQLFLFKGDAASLHQTWPRNISEAIASGSAQVTTLGGKVGDWKHLTAKSLVSAEADFAVVQISARPNLRVPMPPGLFADDVRLTLKTQPALPVRVVQR